MSKNSPKQRLQAVQEWQKWAISKGYIKPPKKRKPIPNFMQDDY